MLFPDSFIDELKHRLPISKIIGKRVSLKKNGLSIKGICPFHKEKTPSFTVHDHKGIYYCFGCHASGDIISFIQQTEKLSFEETIKYLAGQAGLELPKLNPQQQKEQQLKLSLIEILNKASQWFEQQLKLSTNYNAYEYFINRGINEADIKKYSLGYAPNKGLLNYLQKNGAQLNEMVDAGLAIKTQDGSYIERFRNRIIFPIKNLKNQIVGFGGRSLNSEIQPKYLNSPETEVFKKNRLVYLGEVAAKEAIKSERLIVVEGYMDALTMHKTGFNETVATLGTAFNHNHLKLLWNLGNEPILCFDGDEAGKKAMVKAAYTALPLLSPGMTLKFCFLPEKMDPDETIKHYGKEYMKNLLDRTENLSDFIWQNEFENFSLKTPESKALFEQKIYDLTNQIDHPLVKSHYQQYFKSKLWQEFNKINTKRAKFKQEISFTSDIATMSLRERLEYTLFAKMLQCPEILSNVEIYQSFSDLDPMNQTLEELKHCIIKTTENEDFLLKDLLIENNLVKLSEFLCGESSSFVNRISEINVAKQEEIWIITFKKYMLEILKQEYNQLIQKVFIEEKAFDRANELRLSIDKINKDILEKENNLI